MGCTCPRMLLCTSRLRLPQIPRRGGPSKIGEGDQHVAHGPVILVVGVQAHGTVAGKKQRGVVLGATKSVDHGVEQAVDHGVASGLRAKSHQRALRVGPKENAFVILRLDDAW